MTKKTPQKVLPIDTWIVIATLLPPIDALALERVRDESTCPTIIPHCFLPMAGG